jgi:capsular exopolysaccharide synthesis family protein
MNLAAAKHDVQVALDPWRLIHLLAAHAWLIAACTLAGVAAALAYVVHRPPVYVAHAVLEVREDGAAPLDFNRREGAEPNSAALLKTIEHTVASQAVLKNVLQSLKLADDPWFAPPREENYTESELVSLLHQRIHVGLERGTRLIRVSVRDGDPLKAQRLTQALVDSFFAHRALLRREGAGSAHAFLLTEARRLEQEMHAAEDRLQDYQEKHKAVSLTDRHNIVVQRLNDLAQQVTVARAQRLSLEADAAQVRAVIAKNPDDLINIREIAAGQDLVELRKSLNAQLAEVARLGLRYRDKHPTMSQAKRQLAQLQESQRSTLVSAGNAIIQAHRAAVENEQALERELQRQQTQAMELARLAIDFRALEREASSIDALYQQVLARLKNSGLSQSLVATGGLDNPIHLVEQPMVPVRPSNTSAKLLLAGGLLAGAGLGVALVLLRRALDPSLQSIDDAETYLGAPSLAAVPRSSLRDADLVLHTHPATIEAESFRSLRTSLSLLFPDETPKTVLFTSAIPGEGKSYCSANYAAALAQQGLRTLLIDGDLRRPGLRARFALNPQTRGPGLVDCLRQPSRLTDAIRATRVKDLFVVGDLQGSARNSELLAGTDFKALLDLALTVFDRVVVDTAPLTAVGDTSTLAPHVDAVCLVIHAGRTPRRLVRRACVLLGRAPAGLVLNQIKPGRAARYDYYSHGDDYIRETAAAPVSPASGISPQPT